MSVIVASSGAGGPGANQPVVIDSGLTLPPAPSQGQLFYLASASGDAGLYVFDTANNWTQVGAAATASQPGIRYKRHVLSNISSDEQPMEVFIDGVDGTLQMVLSDNSTWTFSMMIAGHRIDAPGGHASFKVEGMICRDIGSANVYMLGQPIVTSLGSSDAWGVQVQPDTAHGSLIVNVFGEPAKTIKWIAVVDVAEATG